MRMIRKLKLCMQSWGLGHSCKHKVGRPIDVFSWRNVLVWVVGVCTFVVVVAVAVFAAVICVVYGGVIAVGRSGSRLQSTNWTLPKLVEHGKLLSPVWRDALVPRCSAWVDAAVLYWEHSSGPPPLFGSPTFKYYEYVRILYINQIIKALSQKFFLPHQN